jgi:hypothetical protein
VDEQPFNVQQNSEIKKIIREISSLQFLHLRVPAAEASLGSTDPKSLKRILKKLIKEELLWQPPTIPQNKKVKTV